MGISFISLETASSIIENCLAKAHELQLNPLSVAVLDCGGHLIAFAREDGSSNLRPQIAIAKASGALCLGVSSRKIGEMALERPTFVTAAGNIAPAGLIPAAGGVLVRNAEGILIGAVGVTGDTSDNDELCAIAGISAGGLVAG